MGSASSASCDTPGGELRLPASGLRFSSNQLRTLNSYVHSLWEEDQKGRMSMELESTVESLVQRIVDGAGQRDPRFRCCHLIALHRGKQMRSRSLEYLVTLDALPILNTGDEDRLVDGPDGYGKIRLSEREAEKWEEFLTPSGYLCRDKVVERWVELIARCARARGGGGSRVLSARARAALQPYEYCYLERASGSQPLPSRRLAIVEGAAWVMVRVGAGEAEAKLVLGARVHGCTHQVHRIPLTHPLALLHYRSLQSGYYAVAIAPPTSVICGDRGSNWQLWNPTLEAALDAHCSELSTVGRTAGALNALLDKMREGTYQGSLRVLSRYAATCALRRRLDRCAGYASSSARCVISTHVSHHLLLVLDELYLICLRGGPAGYLSPIDRDAVSRRGSRGVEWEADAHCITACLQHLHRVVGEDISATPSESLELALFSRWEGLNKEAKASAGNTYCRRQLRYLWRVCSELVTCKNLVSYETYSTFRHNLIQATSPHQESIEDPIHILAIMLDQARDLYVNDHSRTFSQMDRDLNVYRSKKWNKLKDYYDASSACLIDAVRRDPDLRKEDLRDPHVMMKSILQWLYKGTKDDKKYLGPVLRPYLESLFMSSLENSWFLEEMDGRCEREFQGLREFCAAVHDGALEPCAGLLDAGKKFAWAKAAVDTVDRFRHVEFRLVFPTGDGMAISYPIKLPSRRSHSAARTLTLSRRDKEQAKLRLARRCVLAAFGNALLGDKCLTPISRHESEEILASVKTGSYWRTSKPDVIPSSSDVDSLPRVRRRARKSRPVTSHGFPEISITNQSDQKTMRRKYHTLKSLVYKEPVENIKELRQRPRSAGSTVRNKEALSRPSLLETLDFINSVKDALCVEESAASDMEEPVWSIEDSWLIGQAAPLNLLAARCGARALHLAPGDLAGALLQRGKFTILQELCSYLGESSEGALFALHRLARAARSRSTERMSSAWKLPEPEGSCDPPQRYSARALDTASGDEAPPPPPPLPRHASRERGRVTPQMTRYSDYLPPNRIQTEPIYLEPKPTTYTGIINPIYDIKIPKDRFTVKRSRSLGRSFSFKNTLDLSKYNITLGHRSGKKTNDVVTAIAGTTGETGLEYKSSFFQRSTADVVGDSYRLSRATID